MRHRRRLARRLIWGAPAALAVVAAIGGVLLERRVAAIQEQSLEAALTSLRDSNAASLESWLHDQERVVRRVVEEPQVRVNALACLQLARQGEALAARAQEPAYLKLSAALATTLRTWNFRAFVLLDQGTVVQSSVYGRNGERLPEEVEARLSKLDEPQIIPYLSVAHTSSADQGVLLVTAPLKDDAGRSVGALGFELSLADEFTRRLSAARMGESGETYAFDARGILLSASRFDAELAGLGLLTPGQSSLFQLRLADPGANLSRGDAALAGARPLTRAVADATSGHTGVDVQSYRDYRGVPVVGAWTWLSDRGIGLASELDAEEALRPTRFIQTATRVVVGALVILSLALVGGASLYARLRRKTQRLGQYTLVKKLGEGGMGAVYLANHALLRRPTAVKLIRGSRIDSATRRRFEREVQATAQLCHPNTIQVYDYGVTSDGTFYYAMEYLKGQTLEELVATVGPLPPGRVLFLLEQVLGSLSEAHAAGLVHRDIKPANVMVCRRGGVPDLIKVLDFGLVKEVSGEDRKASRTTTSALTGTPHYMAPEQLTHPDTADQRSDLYAVGAVAHFLLTGRVLFDGAHLVAIFTQHLTAPPPAPSSLAGPVVPPELDAWVAWLLDKTPERRPKSAREALASLETLRNVTGLAWSEEQANEFWDQHEIRTIDPDDSSWASAPTVAIDWSERGLSQSGFLAVGSGPASKRTGNE